MSKKAKKDVVELDHPDERDAAQTAVLKKVHGAEGKVDPRVQDVDIEERTVTVALGKLSENGRHWLGVRFTWQKSDSALHEKAGEEVELKKVGVMEYLGWLKTRSLAFLRDGVTEITGATPRGTCCSAVAAYLASLYQLEEVKAAEPEDEEELVRWGKRLRVLTHRLALRKKLADVRMTEPEFALISVAPESDVDKHIAALEAQRAAHTEDDDMADQVQDELAAKRAEKAGVDDVAALKAAAKAKKAGKVEAPKAEEKKPAAKAAPKPAAKKAAKAEPKKNGKAKPAAKPKVKAEPRKKADMSKVKVGGKVKYTGRNEDYRGKMLEVVSKTNVLAVVRMGDSLVRIAPTSIELA